MSERMETPLAGLRVVDLSRVLAGPWMGQLLADLGADVIKIEGPQGDDTRKWGPPFVDKDGSAAYFYACNRGKRSISLDFNASADREHACRLIAKADLVIENFRRGTLAKFGLDAGTQLQAHPRLIWCSITGFGLDGPYKDRAGYDYLIQAMSGLMSITGAPDGPPQRVGIAVSDILTGLYGAVAALAALAQRERTGRGQHIDLSLMDTGVAFLANQAMNYLIGGTPPARTGNYHPNLVPYQIFAVADGHIVIATGNDAQFVRLCTVLGLPGLARAPDYATNKDRVAHRPALIAALEATTRGWRAADLLEALEAEGIPAGPINDIAQVFADPQVIARGLRIDPEGVPGLRTPLRFSDAALKLDRTAPAHDAHRAEILKEIET